MTDTVLQCKQLRGPMKVLTMADESTYNRQRSYIRFIMPDYQVSCLSGTADGRTENSQLAKFKQSTGKTQTVNWQNANSRLAHEWLVGCFTGTVIETSFILFSYRHPAKYSSLFTKSPESPVFIGISGGEESSATLHPLFTTLHLDSKSIGRCVSSFMR